MKARLLIIFIVVVCATSVLGSKKTKKKPSWGPEKDLELCQELCKKIYADCVDAVVSCPAMSTKGFKDAVDQCYRNRNICFRNCKATFPKPGDVKAT